MVKHVFPCACCRTCYSFSLPPRFQLIWTGLVLPKWAAFSIEWFPCPFFNITREILRFSEDQKGNISLAPKRHSQLVLLVFFATDCRNMSKSENCCHFRWNVELYYIPGFLFFFPAFVLVVPLALFLFIFHVRSIPLPAFSAISSFDFLPFFPAVFLSFLTAFYVVWFPCHYVKMPREKIHFSTNQKGIESWASKRHSQLVWKMNDCFTLLKRITRLKTVNSKVTSEDQISYLERYSPKGSCHHDESSMSHTLAQNCHCEFCCGMHLTCKNTPIAPDKNGSVKRPDKVSRSYHRHSQCRMEKLESDPSLSTKPYRSQNWQIAKTVQKCKKQNQVVWKRHGGSWVCHIPSQKVVMKNEAGTSIQRPRSISQNVIDVFVGCRTMTFPAAPCWN